MMKNFVFVLVLIFVRISVSHSQIESATFYSQKDAYVISSSTANYGTLGEIQAGINVDKFGVANSRRTYVYFEITGIPSDAIIVSANLKFYQTSGATTSTSTKLKVERVIQSWVETTINSSNEPDVNTGEVVNSSTYSSNWRTFDVKNHVQKKINGTYDIEGWRVSYYNENQTTADLYKFHSREATNDPVLEINYYRPFNITAANITHCTSVSSSDGSITPTIEKGSGSNTYQWYNSSGVISGQTSSSISGRTYGWYGVEVTGSQGDKFFYSFIIGVTCDEVSITYDPGPNFIDDAFLYSHFSSSNVNYGNYLENTSGKLSSVGTWYTKSSLLKFRLWIDPNLSFTQAGVNLYAINHDISNSNASYLKKVTGDWSENKVTWNTKPGSTATNQVSLAGSTSSSQNYLNTNILSFCNDWKANNLNNYGMILELQSTSNTQRSMRFHSSDATSSRPSISFTFTHNPPLTGTVSAAQTNICSGSTTLLTLSGYPSGSTFQWQISIYGLAFVDIVGATNSTYTTLSSTTVDAIYRCKVSKGDCTPYTSNSVLIQNTPTPTVTVNQPDFCSGANVTITATPSVSGGTYLWSNSATTASIIVAPLTTTSYSVVYTKNGCSSSLAVSTVDVCQMHAKLERILSGNNYKSFAGKLVFYYQEEYSVGNSNLTYSIYPMNNRITPVLSGSGLSQSLEYGDNRYMLDLSSISSGTYILEVENAKKEKFYLRFTK